MKVPMLSVSSSLMLCAFAVASVSVPAYAQKGAVAYPVPAQWENALTIEVAADGQSASGWALVAGKGQQWKWTEGGPITLSQSIPKADAVSKQKVWDLQQRQNSAAVFDMIGFGPEDTEKCQFLSRVMSKGSGYAVALNITNFKEREVNFTVHHENSYFPLVDTYYEKSNLDARTKFGKMLDAEQTGVIGIADNGVTIIVCGPKGLITVRNSVPRWSPRCLVGAPITGDVPAESGSAPVASASGVDTSPDEGEIGLSGVVESVFKGGVTLLVQKIELPDKDPAILESPRKKRILFGADVKNSGTVKAGSKIKVLGKNTGAGKPLTARLIVVDPKK